jgi:site-specific recombinase XerD
VTWNRAVTALDKFFNWALAEHLITTLPFTYNYASSHVPGQERLSSKGRNNALAKVGSRDGVKCITLEDYLVFRDVGLLGLLPDGSIDPDFRGRNVLRNAAFAELLVTTGVRLEEGASILKAEVPDPDAVRWNKFQSCKMRLAHLTTKGDKGRTIWIPKRVIRDHIMPFIQEDRDNAVIKAISDGRYASASDVVGVKTWRGTGCTVYDSVGGEEKWNFEDLSPSFRSRLFLVDESQNIQESGMLWLTEQGMPTTPNNLEVVFNRACRRLLQFGIDLWVTPHTLRHTFAVYMLSQLIKATVGSIVGLGQEKGQNGEGAYRRIIADPLRTLQRLLGHASITSTYKYLTFIEEAEELVDAAVSSWGDRLGGLPNNALVTP